MGKESIEFITLDVGNIGKEHICCAISDKKGENGAALKKAWLTERFEDGLVFRRLNQRGKAFIEYIPAENAWYPIQAEGYMHINCFWVAGQFKGKGYANQLLEDCIADAKAKGKCGVTIISSEKKRGYLSDPDYMKYKGFQAVDRANPFFVLYYLPFSKAAPVPCFKSCAKQGTIEDKGMVLYYTNQCPFAKKYAGLIKEIAIQHHRELRLEEISTREQAQNAPSPFTTYSFFYDGKFVSNEVLSEQKFEKFLTET